MGGDYDSHVTDEETGAQEVKRLAKFLQLLSGRARIVNLGSSHFRAHAQILVSIHCYIWKKVRRTLRKVQVHVIPETWKMNFFLPVRMAILKNSTYNNC